jgi:hypothetical protein
MVAMTISGGSLQQARWSDTLGSIAPAGKGLRPKRRLRLPGQNISANSKPLASRIADMAISDGPRMATKIQSIGCM